MKHAAAGGLYRSMRFAFSMLTLALALGACGEERVLRDAATATATAAATATATQTVTCSASDLYSAIQTAPRTAHSVFCGNVPKAAWGDSPGGLCSGGSCCLSQDTVHDPSGTAITATERVEVRGWVHFIEGYDDAVHGLNEEFLFELRLDLDWDRSPCLPSNVTTINSLDAFSRAFTPFNSLPLALATPAGWAFGGGDDPGNPRLEHNPTIKVEVNGWYPGGRMAQWNRPPPSKWTTVATGTNAPDSRVRWPFDPNRPPSDPPSSAALAAGDYVRLVGTLWEDSNHALGGHIGCWDDGTTDDRGWKELHPVDYMARIQRRPRTGYAASTFGFVTLCDDASIQNFEIAAPPKPETGSNLGYQVILPDGFTTQDHLAPALSVTPFFGDRYRVTVGVEDWSWPLYLHAGRFFGVFRVFWRPPCVPLSPSQGCNGAVCGTASDGCSGTVSCGTCSAGFSCRGGTCCRTCPAALQEGDLCGTAYSSCGNCTACPTNSTCSSGRCRCKANYHACGGQCIPDANLCQ